MTRARLMNMRLMDTVYASVVRGCVLLYGKEAIDDEHANLLHLPSYPYVQYLGMYGSRRTACRASLPCLATFLLFLPFFPSPGRSISLVDTVVLSLGTYIHSSPPFCGHGLAGHAAPEGYTTVGSI